MGTNEMSNARLIQAVNKQKKKFNSLKRRREQQLGHLKAFSPQFSRIGSINVGTAQSREELISQYNSLKRGIEILQGSNADQLRKEANKNYYEVKKKTKLKGDAAEKAWKKIQWENRRDKINENVNGIVETLLRIARANGLSEEAYRIIEDYTDDDSRTRELREMLAKNGIYTDEFGQTISKEEYESGAGDWTQTLQDEPDEDWDWENMF